jgi:hypothetical protein
MAKLIYPSPKQESVRGYRIEAIRTAMRAVNE